jgi:hypothetical protein
MTANRFWRVLVLCDAVRQETSPERAIHAFVESTYVRAAQLAGGDRAALERRTTGSRTE